MAKQRFAQQCAAKVGTPLPPVMRRKIDPPVGYQTQQPIPQCRIAAGQGVALHDIESMLPVTGTKNVAQNRY